MAYDPDDHDDAFGDDLAPDPVPAMGTVLDEARGSLPYALLHGEALVACAAWGLGAAGVTPLDIGTPWSSVVAGGEPFVLHDSLCPMTPASFIADCVAQSVATDAVVVGVAVREEQAEVTSPLVLTPRVVAELGEGGPSGLDPELDLGRMTALLERRHRVERRQAPASGARVRDSDDVDRLADLTRPDGRPAPGTPSVGGW